MSERTTSLEIATGGGEVMMQSTSVELTYKDMLRLHTVVAGDPVGDYYGYPEFAKEIIIGEKILAMSALCPAEVDQSDPASS